MINVLLVEDQALIAENLRQLLDDQGFEVSAVCYSYNQGVRAIDTQKFDIAIFDVNLGGNEGEDGITLASHFKNIQNKPFIFLTAYSDKETIRSAAGLQPAGYLVKPANENTLFSTLQLALHKTQQPVAEKDPEILGSFYLKTGKQMVKIYWQDIRVIEVDRNYVEIIYRLDRKGIIRTSLKNFIENQLPEPYLSNFVRVNRSCYINKNSIIQFDKKHVRTKQGKYQVSEKGYQNLLRQT